MTTNRNLKIEHAKPGDVIEITAPNRFFSEQYLVVECPYDKRFLKSPDDTWVEYLNEIFLVSDPDTYKIVKRATTNNEVDESLKRQLNDNLRSVFI